VHEFRCYDNIHLMRIVSVDAILVVWLDKSCRRPGRELIADQLDDKSADFFPFTFSSASRSTTSSI